jgi:hypothetical protein
MRLSPRDVSQFLDFARRLPLDAPAERVEDWLSRILGLNPIQRAEYSPSPDPNALFAIAIAYHTEERERILREDCSIPAFAVYEDSLGVYQIAGLSTYLRTKGHIEEFLGRLDHHKKIRAALRRLERGQHLEAIAAAIMREGCGYGEATQGSADQGIDAIGWKELMIIDSAFSDGSVTASQVLPGEQTFLFASSKAVIGHATKQRLLNPAHIRELVGGWVIQRSTAGLWRQSGIRMLSPVQMILVTTYRLSTDAKAACRELGVQVWGIPELVYLICKLAPATVFDADNGQAFLADGFRSWWQQRDKDRLMASIEPIAVG